MKRVDPRVAKSRRDYAIARTELRTPKEEKPQPPSELDLAIAVYFGKVTVVPARRPRKR